MDSSKIQDPALAVSPEDGVRAGKVTGDDSGWVLFRVTLGKAEGRTRVLESKVVRQCSPQEGRALDKLRGEGRIVCRQTKVENGSTCVLASLK